MPFKEVELMRFAVPSHRSDGRSSAATSVLSSQPVDDGDGDGDGHGDGDSSRSTSTESELDALLKEVAAIPETDGAAAAISAHAVDAAPRSSRFKIRRKLGQGGFGVVYEAFDHKRGGVVALKVLRKLDGDALYRFKKEFRTLSELALTSAHVVKLYELFGHDAQWFFTMELVSGVDIVTFARAHADGDQMRLRSTMAQLAAGIAAIHRAGSLHRDLKPENVLVDANGTVKIVDFGLVTAAAPSETQTADPSGTPAYIAPETIVGGTPTAATDWYGFGAILYEALTGAYPFAGETPRSLVAMKLTGDPPSPRTRAPDAPADLDALCAALLSRRPEDRPDATEILRVLGAVGAYTVDAAAGAAATNTVSVPFVGRDNELACLRGALAESARGPVCVVIEGESGIGKTALAERFVAEVRSTTRAAAILTGRCYERELVPFRAFDGIVDALSHHLRRLPTVEAAALLPRRSDASLLARLFPVLSRVSSWPSTSVSDAAQLHPQEARSHAFVALRDTLDRLAERGPVVLCIDDAQWADAESFALLDALLEPPKPPPLLVIVTVRSTGASTSGSAERSSPLPLKHIQQRHVPLTGLSPAEVRVLATTIAGAGASTPLDEGALSDAKGHPFFVQELAFRAEHGATDLESALFERVAALGETARTVIELASLSAGPLPFELIADATALSRSDVVDAVTALARARLLTAGADSAAPYHDRVRAVVVRRIEETRRGALHRTLARTHEASGANLGEAVRHLRAAGDDEKAADLAERAARTAVDALAFEHAAELFQVALAAKQHDADKRRALHEATATCWSHAGDGLRAAESYRAAAEAIHAGADGAGTSALRLRAKAAVELYGSGYVVDGERAIVEVFKAIGEPWPVGRGAILLHLLLSRLWLRLRGLTSRPVDEASLADVDRLRLEIHDALGAFLPIMDLQRGFTLHTRALLFALRKGAQRFAAAALAIEGAFRAAGAASSFSAGLELIHEAERRGATPHMLDYANAMARQLSGRFAEAIPFFDTVLARGSGAPGALSQWALDAARFAKIGALLHLGAFRELCDLFDKTIQDAHRRRDWFLESRVLGTTFYPFLVRDEPEEALRQLDECERRTGFVSADVIGSVSLSRLNIALYCGRAIQPDDDSWRRAHRYARSTAMRSTLLRCDALVSLARVELTWGGKHLDSALRRAELIERDVTATFAARRAGFIRAAVAFQRHDVGGALAKLRDVEVLSAGAGEQFWPALARRCMGLVIGGDAGRALVAAADKSMREEQGVASPERFTRMATPGFPPG